MAARELHYVVGVTSDLVVFPDRPTWVPPRPAPDGRPRTWCRLADGSPPLVTWYDMSEWVETEETVSDRLVPMENSIDDQIVVQSGVERKFAEKLKKWKDVKLFVDLHDWFKVATPVGQYNPDWALVMEKPDDDEALLYLVRETKSTTAAVRGTENQKIYCGEKHFVGGLDVDFRVVTSADELP